jgi:hypothetical protein
MSENVVLFGMLFGAVALAAFGVATLRGVNSPLRRRAAMPAGLLTAEVICPVNGNATSVGIETSAVGLPAVSWCEAFVDGRPTCDRGCLHSAPAV